MIEGDNCDSLLCKVFCEIGLFSVKNLSFIRNSHNNSHKNKKFYREDRSKPCRQKVTDCSFSAHVNRFVVCPAIEFGN